MASLTKIVAIAPLWLHEPLAVLLKARHSLTLLACAASVEEVHSRSIRESPDVLILYTTGDAATDQIQQVKAAWPDARCMALVAGPDQQSAAEAAGADVVLLQGLAPGRLMEALDACA